MIEKIVDDGDVEEMHELSCVLVEVLDILKDYNPNKYKEYEMHLYKMAYGCNLSQDMAEEIVSKMQPYGEKWSIQATRQIQDEYGLQHLNPIDFYVVINSAYNDYSELFRDNVDMYVKFTQLFMEDEDAKKDKVFLYFTKIVE
jgi:hypothetical protein